MIVDRPFAVFASCVRMEIRRAHRLLTWFLAALVLASWAQGAGIASAASAWGGPMLGVARLLALAMVVASIWQDAPLRRDRFLATRPQNPPAVWLAKILMLTAMLVAPIALADGYLIFGHGLGFAAAFNGMLQSCALHLVVLAACFPAIIFWRTAATGWIAAGSALAAIILTSIALLHHPGNFERYSGGRPTLPWSALWFAASCLLFTIAGLVAMAATRRWPEPARIATSVLIAAATFTGGLFLSLRQPVPRQSIAANNPSIVLQNSLSGGKTVQSLVVMIPKSTNADEGDPFFHFRRIRVNGRKLTPWRVPPPEWMEHAPTVREALARRLDINHPGWVSNPPDGHPHWLRMPQILDPLEPHHIAFEAVERIYQLDVVAVLPVAAGASASIPGSRWELLDQPLHQKLPDGWVPGPLHVISYHFHPLFAAPGANLAEMEFVLLVNLRTGVSRMQYTTPAQHISSVVTRRITPIHPWWNHHDSDLKPDDPEEIRIVILRPRLVRDVAHHWASPQPQSLPLIERP